MANKVWTQSGRETLLASSDLLNPTLSLLDELFENITNQIANTGATRAEWRFNNLSTNIYATRFNQNGAGDATGASQSAGVLGNTSANAEDNFNWFYLNNITGREKMLLNRTMDAGGASASSAPQRIKGWIKAASTVALTSIQVTNLFGGGDFGIGSNMQVSTTIPEVGLGQLGSWVEVARKKTITLGGSILVDNIPDRRYLQVLWTYDRPGANIDPKFEFNAVTATDYAIRGSLNGAADVTSGSQINLDVSVQNSANTVFGTALIGNLAGREKLLVGNITANNASGAANVPPRRERVGKMDTTTNSASISQIELTGVSDFGIGSEVVVLGWTPSDSTTTESNFWQPLGEFVLGGTADTMGVLISPKKYLWLQWYVSSTSPVRQNLTFNNDVGTNYSRRSSVDGGGDLTATSSVNIQAWPTQNDLNYFFNIFIVNVADQEKLLIGHNSSKVAVGAGTAPSRTEFVAKWANIVSPITKIDIDNDAAGSYLAGSFVRVWGHD